MLGQTRRMAIELRAATVADSVRLREIEREAGEQFRTVGMADVADHDPFTVEELHAYAAGGRSWVAAEGVHIVGYVVIDCVGRAAHIEQVSVVPEAQGRGIGRLLVDRVREWAVENGLSALTLTSFREVSWNAPLYAHLGFRILAEGELTSELRAIREHEADQGLDHAQRVCMQLDL